MFRVTLAGESQQTLLATSGPWLLSQIVLMVSAPSWGMKAVGGPFCHCSSGPWLEQVWEALCSESQPAPPQAGGAWEPSHRQAVPAAFPSPEREQAVFTPLGHNPAALRMGSNLLLGEEGSPKRLGWEG